MQISNFPFTQFVVSQTGAFPDDYTRIKTNLLTITYQQATVMIERREIDPNINIIILVSVITTLFHNHHYFLTILILYTICAILALLMVGTRPLLDHAPLPPILHGQAISTNLSLM